MVVGSAISLHGLFLTVDWLVCHHGDSLVVICEGRYGIILWVKYHSGIESQHGVGWARGFFFGGGGVKYLGRGIGTLWIGF